MNIYEKLIEVRKAVPYLKKDNAGYQFKYVSSSQTLGAVRAEMDQQKLLLIPEVTAKEVREHVTSKGGKEFFTELNITFTWVNAENPEERISCPWYGQGIDSGEKGVGKAMTYAEKFFLLKFFNIATDKDDPDSFQEKNANVKQNYNHINQPAETKKDSNDNGTIPMTADEIKEKFDMYKTIYGDEDFYSILKTTGHKTLSTVKSIREAERILKVFENQGENNEAE